MLCSIETEDPSKGQIHSMVSAGILAQKDGIKRLTCSYHNWEQQDRMHPGTLGKGDATTREIFRVVQGMTNDDKPGTPVGCLRKRFEDNNIAFAQLDNGIHFENQFFEPLGTNPKVLLALEDAEFRDEFLVETFPGGRERLRCVGARFPLSERERQARTHPILCQGAPRLEDGEKYVKCRQTLFMGNQGPAVNSPYAGAVVD